MATVNAWGLPWPLAPRRAERLARTVAWLDDSDLAVAGLQEVWRGARRHLPPEHVHLPDGPDSGLALYTSHPVRDLQLVPFHAARGVDRWKAKGMLQATVELPGLGDVRFVVVHLQAGADPRNASVRTAQVLELLARLPEGPCVLMGDLNVHRGSRRDRASLADLAVAGFTELTPPKPEQGTSRYGAHRFDRVFVRGGPATRWVVEQVTVHRGLGLSDHHPVSARLRRTRPPSSAGGEVP